MKTAIALGTFDGLHTGHRAVLDKVLPFYSVAVTFSYPPKFYFTKSHELIMSADDKCRALKEYGIKQVDIQDFESLKDLTAEEFLNKIYEKYHPVLISCGFNYRFGKNALGDVELIKRFCLSKGIELSVSECVAENGIAVSSTYIRELILSGKIDVANRFIYGGFSFSGEVLHGDSRGHTLGFPTANLRYPDNLVKMKAGVYKVEVIIDGKSYKGISNIGLRPTFLTREVMSETFIKDFDRDIYGKNITVKPLLFLRGEKKFESVDELVKAVKKDIESI